MGRFSAEPRHYPLSGFFSRQQQYIGSDKAAMKGEKAHLMRKYLESSITLANDMFSVDDTDGKLAPKMPTYSHQMDDELDAVLGFHLLRGHVERFVDDLHNDLATADAGVPSGEARVTMALDPNFEPEASEEKYHH